MLSSPHLLNVHLPDPARFLMHRNVHPPRLQPALTRDPYAILPPHASLSQSTLVPPPPPPSLPDAQSKSLRKHVCQTCERAFSTSGHLARHLRVHTGERNHKCPFPGCETRCSRQDNLQQHYRIHLSPGSRRGSGSATRAAMTKAKSSAELALEAQELSRTSRLAGIGTGGKQGTRGGPGTITPSPSGSPSELRAQTLNYAPQIPEPPDTPPPLAPAIAHPGYAYPIPPGTASSCSSTPSIPEHQFSSASGQPRPHVQVDFTSTRSSHSHSPEQSYASPTQSHGGGGFQSATDHTAAWVYSGHTAHYQQQQYLPTHQQQVLHSHQRTKSVSPTQRTQPAHAHAASAQYGYDYSENYQLQYPDTSAVQSAEYAQPVSAPSRQSVPHISPSRPPMSMLGSEGTSGYGGAGARYDAPTAALLSRYIGNDAGTPVAGSSVHHGHASQGSMAQSYPPTAPNAPVESRTMYAYSDQSPHRYGEPQAGEDAASAYYAAGYGGPAAERSSPRTLPPIQTARIVRDDSQQQQQQPQPQHAQPSPTSALDASHQQASYAYSTSYHQQQQQQQQQMSAEHVHPQTHAQEPDRAPAPADVPLHQPRPHYSPQQYGAFYAPAAAAAGGGYYRRAGHDHIVAR